MSYRAFQPVLRDPLRADMEIRNVRKCRLERKPFKDYHRVTY